MLPKEQIRKKTLLLLLLLCGWGNCGIVASAGEDESVLKDNVATVLNLEPLAIKKLRYHLQKSTVWDDDAVREIVCQVENRNDLVAPTNKQGDSVEFFPFVKLTMKAHPTSFHARQSEVLHEQCQIDLATANQCSIIIIETDNSASLEYVDVSLESFTWLNTLGIELICYSRPVKRIQQDQVVLLNETAAPNERKTNTASFLLYTQHQYSKLSCEATRNQTLGTLYLNISYAERELYPFDRRMRGIGGGHSSALQAAILTRQAGVGVIITVYLESPDENVYDSSKGLIFNCTEDPDHVKLLQENTWSDRFNNSVYDFRWFRYDLPGPFDQDSNYEACKVTCIMRKEPLDTINSSPPKMRLHRYGPFEPVECLYDDGRRGSFSCSLGILPIDKTTSIWIELEDGYDNNIVSCSAKRVPLLADGEACTVTSNGVNQYLSAYNNETQRNQSSFVYPFPQKPFSVVQCWANFTRLASHIQSPYVSISFLDQVQTVWSTSDRPCTRVYSDNNSLTCRNTMTSYQEFQFPPGSLGWDSRSILIELIYDREGFENLELTCIDEPPITQWLDVGENESGILIEPEKQRVYHFNINLTEYESAYQFLCRPGWERGVYGDIIDETGMSIVGESGRDDLGSYRIVEIPFNTSMFTLRVIIQEEPVESLKVYCNLLNATSTESPSPPPLPTTTLMLELKDSVRSGAIGLERYGEVVYVYSIKSGSLSVNCTVEADTSYFETEVFLDKGPSNDADCESWSERVQECGVSVNEDNRTVYLRVKSKREISELSAMCAGI